MSEGLISSENILEIMIRILFCQWNTRACLKKQYRATAGTVFLCPKIECKNCAKIQFLTIIIKSMLKNKILQQKYCYNKRK